MANYISKLIIHYFNKLHNPDTEIKIQQWLTDESYSREKDETLFEIWEQLGGKADKNVYASLRAVNVKIGETSSRSWFLKHTLLRVAAVLIPLLVLTGVWVYQANHIEIIEIATGAGERKQIKLPDGSTVWMNACSKIVYPGRFKDTVRNISLTGEAYFSVTRSKTKRFIVSAGEFTVEVLGTQFNIKAYPDDKIATATLTSGKVSVILSGEKYMLTPNQELVYDSEMNNAVIRIVPEDVTGWIDGSLVFDDLTMGEIFKELERRFGVKIIYEQDSFPADRYSMKFTGRDSLDRILNILRDVAGDFSYTSNNKIITIII